jgi:hypothetical protein
MLAVGPRDLSVVVEAQSRGFLWMRAAIRKRRDGAVGCANETLPEISGRVESASGNRSMIIDVGWVGSTRPRRIENNDRCSISGRPPSRRQDDGCAETESMLSRHGGPPEPTTWRCY